MRSRRARVASAAIQIRRGQIPLPFVVAVVSRPGRPPVLIEPAAACSPRTRSVVLDATRILRLAG